ncbi:Lrp/AsnC family transcriptional regulator [Thermasporomyces composti]|jgi:Lrp/AsnC family leucine-responsive transcriptional regulator|uniref:AsnC family transcriptional regulator n=1 Tax=Thermasporomyces composti TaxID=696763 RepID=A0A3D9V6F3_THECX|nr:Lrp/AsnC family transcriptional regulator [Thermasporomyces composti]REF37097.1 AsnC family transcriptional regulator [Thermasporomyces composti]
MIGGSLDDVDRQLIAHLRKDGRASYAELGRIVGLSGPSVLDRIRRLEERGVLTGYRALVRPSALGLGVTALIGLVLSDNADQSQVLERLEKVSDIEDCWYVAGGESYIVKVRVRDVDALEELLGRLQRIRGISRTRTTLVLSTKWEGRMPPGDLGAFGVDEPTREPKG